MNKRFVAQGLLDLLSLCHPLQAVGRRRGTPLMFQGIWGSASTASSASTEGDDAIPTAAASVPRVRSDLMTTSIKPPIPAQTPARQLQIRALSPDQLRDLLGMVGRCSPSTLFHRFHGITDGTAYIRHLVAASGHESLTAWSGTRCIGVATLARSACDHELGILVEDGWQRRGIGTELLTCLVAFARARGIDRIVADVLGEDSFVLSALRRVGPLVVTLESGVYTVRVNVRPVLGEPDAP